jgi:hypothetical protein
MLCIALPALAGCAGVSPATLPNAASGTAPAATLARTAATAAPSPTPVPTPTDSPNPGSTPSPDRACRDTKNKPGYKVRIVVKPCPINLGGITGSTLEASVAEEKYSGSFTLSSDAPAVVEVTPQSESGDFLVQGTLEAGATDIIVTDSNGNFVAVPVNNQGLVLQ